MITDEKIIQVAKKHGIEIDDMSQIHAARELIALAQQVKPLQFEPCQLQSPVLPLAYLNAKSPLGRYLIHKYKEGGKTVYFFTGPNRVASDNETEAEAIAAANADYQRRVLSCLVHGGV